MAEITADVSLPEGEDDVGYNAYIEEMRREQYPMLGDALFLDHAGTTLTSKRLMDIFHKEMVSNLYGNPHSFSQSSQRTAHFIDAVRVKLLSFLKADPRDFDVVFTANATASAKLVAEALRDAPSGFDYCYHNEAHTSLVGVRELAQRSTCFETDEKVDSWLQELASCNTAQAGNNTLFAYPAQSNLNGRRLPLAWCERLRGSNTGMNNIWSLLDAAAYVSTTPLDLSNEATAPDFTVMSLYKIFGFPDLGALIVRRRSAHALDQRKYFGGGTVDMVINPQTGSKGDLLHRGSHAKKTTSIHDRLEDGTLPYHSIIALDCAMTAHAELFGSLDRVSRHTQYLSRRLVDGLVELKHANNRPVVQTYSDAVDKRGVGQGPVVAFNLIDKSGHWISLYEFEKLAFAQNVNVRTGGLCNPGGTASYLSLTADQIRNNYQAGYRCGSESDIVGNKPTGVIRASFGAMSTASDVDRFLSFLEEFYIERPPAYIDTNADERTRSRLRVESLTVYPIKSCAGWTIPYGTQWEVRPSGLVWDREWCVVHAVTGKALSQKRYTKMALIRPELDLSSRSLIVRGMHSATMEPLRIDVPLRPWSTQSGHSSDSVGEVCGTSCNLSLYESPVISDFFTNCIGVPCRLARFPDPAMVSSRRHAKEHLNRGMQGLARSIAFSNESPILTITRASLNRLNEIIKMHHGKAASPAVFRANIVLGETESSKTGHETPYAEDNWSGMTVGKTHFDFLDGCRRCQMVCIDQTSGERNAEPFSTLSKTRRIDGRVLFGVHTALAESFDGFGTIRAGDEVAVFQYGREG